MGKRRPYHKRKTQPPRGGVEAISANSLTAEEIAAIRYAVTHDGIGWADFGDVLAEGEVERGDLIQVHPATIELDNSDIFYITLRGTYNDSSTVSSIDGRAVTYHSASGETEAYYEGHLDLSPIKVMIDINFFPSSYRNTVTWHNTSGGVPAGSKYIKLEGPVVYHRISQSWIAK